MKVISTAEGESTLTLTTIELVLLNNAVNESLQALPDWEYPIRVGVTKDEARTLLDQLGRLLDEIPVDS